MAPPKVETAAPPGNGYRTKSDIARQHIQELILSGRAGAGVELIAALSQSGGAASRA